MRSHISSKPKFFPEDVGVYVPGISVEVSVHYPGRSAALSTKRLLASRGADKKPEMVELEREGDGLYLLSYRDGAANVGSWI